MGKASNRTSLDEKPLARARVLGSLNEFHCDRTIEQRVVGEINLTHRTATE